MVTFYILNMFTSYVEIIFFHFQYKLDIYNCLFFSINVNIKMQQVFTHM